MPGALRGVILVMVLGLLLNIVSVGLGGGGFVGILFSLCVLGGLFEGSNIVRGLVRGAAVLHLVVTTALVYVYVSRSGEAPPVTVFSLSGAADAFVFYALGRDDVREWMYQTEMRRKAERDAITRSH